MELAAKWTPDALARQIGLALELATLEGREAVFAEIEGRASFAADPFGFIFEEQIAFLKQKRPTKSKVWTDHMYGDHDRAFVIAGAKNLDMLQEFQNALAKTVPGQDIGAFTKEFDRLVEEYGWSYNGGRGWRIRTIFQTNVRTSYMAGRLKQMRQPEVVALRPYWQYVHGETRTPLNPRPQHVAWDGLVLMHDDPWWDIYFPPNDWRCSCGVRTLTERDLLRLGKTGPDKAPEIKMVPTSTGRGKPEIMYPDGVGYGWGYQPGDQWARGLTPELLEEEAVEPIAPVGGGAMPQIVQIDRPRPVEELIRRGRPFTTEVLPGGREPEYYADAFMKMFDGRAGQAVLWQDKAGNYMPMSDDMLRDRAGRWKLKRGRERHVLQMAETMLDPDEIWLGVRARHGALHDSFQHFITRRYIRAGKVFMPDAELMRDTGFMGMHELGRRHWTPVTTFQPTIRGDDSSMDFDYLAELRVGKLLWSR
ncbi:MAG: PBECR2 nuclease fold domain-containing protein [Paracoccus sp. (in: a-proteobacteria)]|uniref:PBECR2 nuclease fold domain-containing protein n=1 Tax=Paracoccus sp. TaxID=267 RepID=UPI0026DF03B8|nr:PBECR2 nuclease fold domain-containing protein [Paracoccus sp. (in: a-proteobacteria)]MDO5622310.1 PBECR2 nuclease fold domain-containing protein [Paracoccus sp. (in: a-proteobacteria)]